MNKLWEKHDIVHDFTWREKFWTKAYSLTTSSGSVVIYRAYFDFRGPDPLEISHSIGVNIPESECNDWRLILNSSEGKEEILSSEVKSLIEHTESTFCVS